MLVSFIIPYAFYFRENILLEPMFEVPGSNIGEVVINEAVVKGKSQATYVHRPGEPRQASEEEPPTTTTTTVEREEVSVGNN